MKAFGFVTRGLVREAGLGLGCHFSKVHVDPGLRRLVRCGSRGMLDCFDELTSFIIRDFLKCATVVY